MRKTAEATIWTLTDGKAGDEVQCLGVGEALAARLPGCRVETRRVAPRRPWSWMMPWGPIPPEDAPGRAGSVLAPPFPDIAIASGRRAVAYLKALKRASPATFTVFLKDPRTGSAAADFIWVPEHDRLRGANVLATLTSPHRISAAVLAAERANRPADIAGLPGPRVTVLIGGDSKDYRFTPEDNARLLAGLAELRAQGAGLMVTVSRRTPAALVLAARQALTGPDVLFYDGTGPNPYRAFLAHADAIVVSADSVNMVGEAAATGVPVLLFEPTGGSQKISRFLNGLKGTGAVHPFTASLAFPAYLPIDSTPIIADEIMRRFLRARA